MRWRLFLSLSGLATTVLVLHVVLADRGVPGPAALAFLFALLIAAVLTPLLARPLARAATFAARLSRGESPPRLAEAAPGEAGDLYRALNRLAEQLRQALEAHGAEKTETEVLLRELGEGVLALDREGRITRVNRELRSLIGVAERLEGRSLAAVVRNPELVRFLSPETVSEEGRQGEFDLFGRIMRVTARRLPEGGVVAVCSDLTELRRLDAVRTEFVANASHELKTPLTAVRGYAETLLDPSLPPDKREAFAGRIVSQAERMAAIVEDLLTLAKLEEPGYAIERRRILVKPLVERVGEKFSRRAHEAGMTFSSEVSPDDLEVVGDRTGLEHVLENLVDNAIRHSEGTTIGVEARALASGVVELLIWDDGRGIPATHLERIFERFYRVDPSRSRSTGGTGLGLSIVKHWVEAMGGEVRAESAVGGGTRICVRLSGRGH